MNDHYDCGPLCPEHGDPRLTNLAPNVLPFVLREPRQPAARELIVTVRLLVHGSIDRVRVAQQLEDALAAARVPFIGPVEVSQA